MQTIFWNWSPSIFKLCQSRDQWDSNEWFPISKTFPFLQSSSSRKEEFEIINMYMQNMEVYYCMGKIIIISLHHITWLYLLWKVMLTFLHCLLFLSPIKVLYKQITVIKNPRNTFYVGHTSFWKQHKKMPSPLQSFQHFHYQLPSLSSKHLL